MPVDYQISVSYRRAGPPLSPQLAAICIAARSPPLLSHLCDYDGSPLTALHAHVTTALHPRRKPDGNSYLVYLCGPGTHPIRIVISVAKCCAAVPNAAPPFPSIQPGSSSPFCFVRIIGNHTRPRLPPRWCRPSASCRSWRMDLCSHASRSAATLGAPPRTRSATPPDAWTCARTTSARLPRSGLPLGTARIGAAPPGVLCSAVPSRAAAAAITVLSPPVSPAVFGAARRPAGGPRIASLALREGPTRGRAAR